MWPYHYFVAVPSPLTFSETVGMQSGLTGHSDDFFVIEELCVVTCTPHDDTNKELLTQCLCAIAMTDTEHILKLSVSCSLFLSITPFLLTGCCDRFVRHHRSTQRQ